MIWNEEAECMSADEMKDYNEKVTGSCKTSHNEKRTIL